MEYSLPAWLGALVGVIIAVALYMPGIRLIERHIRAQNEVVSLEQRESFEQKLSVVRRLILGVDIAILATLGYWVGKAIGTVGTVGISPPLR
ncbi:MAG TPA: hypothetical protein VMF12_02085 [Xanthobacteraceae bacterium]|nr:hypothetical protein [Xanthobacteraceae bacterium]